LLNLIQPMPQLAQFTSIELAITACIGLISVVSLTFHLVDTGILKSASPRSLE